MPSRAFFYLQEPAPPSADQVPQYLDNELSKISEVFKRESAYGKYDVLSNPTPQHYCPSGAGYPSRDSFDGCLLFGASAVETLQGVTIVPHTWRVDYPLIPYAAWSPQNTNTGNVYWQLQYTVASISFTFPSYSNLTVLTSASGVTDSYLHSDFPEMAMQNQLEGCAIKWELTRVGTDASDTYTGDAKLLDFGFHIQKEKHGTNTPTAGS